MFSLFPEKKESYFLQVLWDGLELLHRQISELENAEIQNLKTSNKRSANAVQACGFSRFGSGADDTLIINIFVWYASSAACFLGLFEKAFNPKESYRNRFQAMLKWRDKVAAHTAYVDPVTKNKNILKVDSIESQDASIMMTPDWDNDHYSVGGWIFSSGTSSSHQDWRWSLSQTHPEIRSFLQAQLPRS